MQYINAIQGMPLLESYTIGKFIDYPFGDSDLPYFVPNKNTNYIIGVLEENLGKEGPDRFYYEIENNELYIIAGFTPPECLYYGFIQYLFRRNDNILFSSITDTINSNIVDELTDRKYNVPIMILMSKNPKVMDIAYNFLTNQTILPIPFVYRWALPDKFIPGDKFVTILRVAGINPVFENYLEDTRTLFFKLKFNERSNDPTNKYCFYAVGQPIVNNPSCKNGFFQKKRDSNIDEFQINGLLAGFNLYTRTILNVINEQKGLYLTKGCCKCKNKCKCKRKPDGPINPPPVIPPIVNPPIVIPPVTPGIPPGYLEIITQPWGFLKNNQYFVIDTGYNCIDNNINCIGDNRDTTYRISDVIFTENIDFVVIVAVNHIVTNKALYNNINIYDNETQESLYNLDVVDTNHLYYYLIIKKDALKKSDGQISKQIFVAERVYLQKYISPSYETIIPYKVFINTV